MSEPQPPSDPVVHAYAEAILTAARAEDALERVEDELFQFARALEQHGELRDRLADPMLDTATKLEVLGDLIGRRAHPQTVAAIVWVIQAERARQLKAIADGLVALAARERAHSVAEVRSAVPLSDDQQRRLSEALEQSTGVPVDVKVVVDPEVVGGLVVRMGDTVIDGSVASRLSTVRSHLQSA